MKVDFYQSQDFDVGIIQEQNDVQFNQDQSFAATFENEQPMVVDLKQESFKVDLGYIII